ncbi:MAG: hypothetical protein EOP50_20000 [Sphingobacteriales bacterium]|nr:MAG: hypothetical protein EOP50_20000 [Sphingobacteriales bacterium]
MKLTTIISLAVLLPLTFSCTQQPPNKNAVLDGADSQYIQHETPGGAVKPAASSTPGATPTAVVTPTGNPAVTQPPTAH